jgi:hypothetical protein
MCSLLQPIAFWLQILATQDIFLNWKLLQDVAGVRGKAEIKLGMAFRSGGHGPGGRCCGATSGLLAQEDELAGTRPRAFLPGVHGLRHKASF